MALRVCAPFSQSERSKYENSILTRHAGQPEEAYRYIERVANRQIDKAHGVLTFSGLIAAAAQIDGNKFAVLASLLSATIMLLIFIVQWAPSSVYEEEEVQFRHACKVVYLRSYAILLGIVIVVTGAFSLAP